MARDFRAGQLPAGAAGARRAARVPPARGRGRAAPGATGPGRPARPRRLVYLAVLEINVSEPSGRTRRDGFGSCPATPTCAPSAAASPPAAAWTRPSTRAGRRASQASSTPDVEAYVRNERASPDRSTCRHLHGGIGRHAADARSRAARVAGRCRRTTPHRPGRVGAAPRARGRRYTGAQQARADRAAEVAERRDEHRRRAVVVEEVRQHRGGDLRPHTARRGARRGRRRGSRPRRRAR